MRIAIDNVPPKVPLVSGMTATVTIEPAGAGERRDWLSQLFNPSTPRPNCVGTDLQGRPIPESLPAPQEAPAPTSKDLDPGLVPGIDQSPRVD